MMIYKGSPPSTGWRAFVFSSVSLVILVEEGTQATKFYSNKLLYLCSVFGDIPVQTMKKFCVV